VVAIAVVRGSRTVVVVAKTLLLLLSTVAPISGAMPSGRAGHGRTGP